MDALHMKEHQTLELIHGMETGSVCDSSLIIQEPQALAQAEPQNVPAISVYRTATHALLVMFRSLIRLMLPLQATLRG